jgi:hypothetical protein
MNSLGLLILNDLDDIFAVFFLILSGENLDGHELEVHTRRDHHFSKIFAYPHALWVLTYSLFFIHVLPIENPVRFINIAYISQILGVWFGILLFYLIFYCTKCSKIADKFIVEETDQGKDNDEEKDKVELVEDKTQI